MHFYATTNINDSSSFWCELVLLDETYDFWLEDTNPIDVH